MSVEQIYTQRPVKKDSPHVTVRRRLSSRFLLQLRV